MSRLIDADKLKKDIAKLHVLHDEKEIRRMYYANPHTSLADFEEILVRIFDAIEAAPTIEMPKWIPCSESLPNEGELVLVSNPHISGVGYYRNRHWYIANNVSWDAWRTTDVVAWMPLPQPYEETEQ